MAKVDFDFFARRYQEDMSRPTGGGTSYWKVKCSGIGQPPHRNRIRLMEAHENMIVTREDGTRGIDYIIDTLTHYGLGLKMDIMSPCLEFYGLPCPACERVDQLFEISRNDPDPVRQKQAKDLAFRIRKKPQFFAQIVDMNEPGKGVQVWKFGPELVKKIRGCFWNDRNPPEWQDITDPVTGRDIIIEATTKKGQGATTDTYPDYQTVRAVAESTAIDPVWLTQIRDLTQELFQPTTEQVRAAMAGARVVRPQPAVLPPGSMPANVRPLTTATLISMAPPPTTTAAAAAPATAPATALTTVTPLAAAANTASAAPPVPQQTSIPKAAYLPGQEHASVPSALTPRKAIGTPAPAAAPSSDPLAAAEAEVLRLGAPHGLFAAIRCTREELDADEKPGCYGQGQDFSDKICRDCRGQVWCRGVMMQLIPA